LVYTNGTPDHKVNNESLVDHLEKVIRERVADKQKAEAAKDHLIASSS
jgi:(E)-4-hydroxy-3-methylbut-2-enyl-diphosphate synthase